MPIIRSWALTRVSRSILGPGIGTRFGTRGLNIGPHRGRSTTTAEFSAPTGSYGGGCQRMSGVLANPPPVTETTAGGPRQGLLGRRARRSAATCATWAS